MAVKMKMGEDFYSAEVDADEFRDIVKGFVRDAYPNDDIDSMEVNVGGIIEVKLKSGKEIEIEIDWNEFVLK